MVKKVETVEFVEQVRQWLVAAKWSNAKLARAVGYSGATISQFLTNTYSGDSSKVRDALRAVMEREEGKAAESVPAASVTFVETTVSRYVFEVARSCHFFGDIGVCYSAAGLGKTESVREYARQHPDVILIEADPYHSAAILFEELRDALGGSARRCLHDVFVECCQRLTGSGRLLIVDEAEQLPYKALEMLRRLHDKTGIGILLTGMPRLLANLRGRRDEYAQLYSRVGIAKKLSALTKGDVSAILNVLLPGGSKEVCDALFTSAAGNTRRLMKLILRTKHLAHINAAPVSADIVNSAAALVKVEIMS